MTNRAAVMPELGRIEVQDLPLREPVGREVVVRIEAVGVCGSDTTYFTVGYIGDWIVDGPIILGHEVSGQVHAVGPEVTHVAAGDRVAIEPGTPCRDCPECRSGSYHLCADFVFLATPPHDGALLEYLTIDERNLFRIPDDMSYEEGALLEPLSVGIWACERAGLTHGDHVLVSGAGPVGVLAAQVARALGAASVTIVDLSEFRLQFAESLGFRALRADAAEIGAGFDVLLECSGAPTALADGLARLGATGRAAMVGMPKTPVTLPLSSLNVNELSIFLVNRYKDTWPTAIALASDGRVDLAPLVTHRFPLEQTAEALMLAREVPDSMKAIIQPQL
jgi:L-iditol 2-dehydrogenase